MARVARSEHLLLLIYIGAWLVRCFPLIFCTAEQWHLLLLLLKLSSALECEVAFHSWATRLTIEKMGNERCALIGSGLVVADGQKLVSCRLAEEMVIVMLELQL